MERPRIWLIAGPTASGKTALALTMAEQCGAEVVNADSMQIYRDLPVLTARPSAEEEARAPHHLIAMVDAAEAWSVGRWQTAALAVLNDIAARGRSAIVVGGTGLYFRALTHGLADTPAVSEAERQRRDDAFAAEGETAFRARLAVLDPAAAARIEVGDRQRLIRAMAVAEVTGRPLSAWQAETTPPLAADAWTGLVLDPPRDALYARCDARFGKMIGEGGRCPRSVAQPPGAQGRRLPRTGGSHRRRDLAGRSPGRRPTGHPQLRQAPGHLVPQPNARLGEVRRLWRGGFAGHQKRVGTSRRLDEGLRQGVADDGAEAPSVRLRSETPV